MCPSFSGPDFMRMRLLLLGGFLLWLLLTALIATAFISRAVLGAEQELAALAQRLEEQITQQALADETVLDSFAAFSGMRERDIARQEQLFVSQMQARYPQLTALERIERVEDADRERWLARQRARWGMGFQLHAYRPEDGAVVFPLPAQPAFYSLVSIQPLPDNVKPLLGTDISHDRHLRLALQETQLSGRTATSLPFMLREGYRGYLLIRALPRQVGVNDRFIAMVVRADALKPATLLLPEGVGLKIWHQRDSRLQPELFVDQPAAPRHWFETLGLPHLQLTQHVGDDTQPLVVRLDWRLGWSVLSVFERVSILLVSVVMLLLIALAARFYWRQQRHYRAREDHLFHLANHDRLTGLANRNLFYDRLQHAVSRQQRSQKKLAVLFLDMDRFKPVNDRYGHAIGDKVLQLVAARILSVMRAEDTVARLGGDEFVLLMEDVVSGNEADQVAERLKHAIQQPFEVEGHAISLGVSIGIAYYPEDGVLIDELLDAADRKMYGDKTPAVAR